MESSERVVGAALRFLNDLLIITPQVVLSLLLGGLVALLLAVRSARRRRWSATAGAAALASVLLPAAAADAVNVYFQYLPRLADVLNQPTWPTAAVSAAGTPSVPGLHPSGAVVRLPVPGTVSGFGTRTALVYLPPQYFTEPTARFPVVYLLHGSPGAPIDWFRAARAADAGLAAARTGAPVILVAPRASRRWSDDSECVDGPHGHVETYLTRDVPAAVDAVLRTRPNRSARAVAGNSAGGYCALNLGLRHRNEFSVILDLSGYDRPSYSGGMTGLFGPQPGLARLVSAETPAAYVAGLATTPRLQVWLDSGTADRPALADARRMAALLTGVGEGVVLRQRPGGHEYGVWRPALREALLWASPLLQDGHGSSVLHPAGAVPLAGAGHPRGPRVPPTSPGP